jgi:charged multivesicular body protein 7
MISRSDLCDFSCKVKATAAVRQQHKSLALSYLRSRKQLEDVLTQRLGSLEILQSTLIRVEGAANDIQVRCIFYLSSTRSSDHLSRIGRKGVRE